MQRNLIQELADALFRAVDDPQEEQAFIGLVDEVANEIFFPDLPDLPRDDMAAGLAADLLRIIRSGGHGEILAFELGLSLGRTIGDVDTLDQVTSEIRNRIARRRGAERANEAKLQSDAPIHAVARVAWQKGFDAEGTKAAGDREALKVSGIADIETIRRWRKKGIIGPSSGGGAR